MIDYYIVKIGKEPEYISPYRIPESLLTTALRDLTSDRYQASAYDRMCNYEGRWLGGEIVTANEDGDWHELAGSYENLFDCVGYIAKDISVKVAIHLIWQGHAQAMLDHCLWQVEDDVATSIYSAAMAHLAA